MNAKPKRLDKKIAILIAIRDGIKEVKESKQKGENLQTLAGFLKEDDRSIK